MKIAMWTSWEVRCGIASYTADLVAALRPLGVEVDVVPVPYTDRDPERMSRALERLNAADLVHLQHEYTFFGGIIPRASTLPLYYRRLRRPLVVTAHTVFDAAELLRLPAETRIRQRVAKRLLASYPPYRRSLERFPFQAAGAVIVPTESARLKLVGRGLRPEGIRVVPWGMPEPCPAGEPEVEAMRDRFRLRGRKVVTVFGYVHPDKGYEVALEALAALPPSVKLLIAGGTRVERERAYMGTLEETIRARGLGERVAVTGYLDDPQVAAAMAVSDLVLVPHTAANGSYSVNVALSCGKPVLASDLPCFREIHQESGGLELFPSGDDHSLAERLGFLLASAGARRRLSEAARAHAAPRRWPAIAERTREIYREVVGGSGGVVEW